MTAAKEDKRLSEKKKMEVEDSLRTLECLRGRLLAERQASRVAKEEAQLMGNKLIELENKLREETKLRQKAEKKLKFLKKKLESLKISPALEELDQSDSYENCGSSCTSSATTSGPKDQESVTKAQDFEDMKENVQDTAASTQNHSSLPTESSSSTRDTLDANYDSNLKDSLLPQYSYQCTPSCQDSKAETQSYSKLEAPMESNERRSESDNEDYVDNTLALVPVAFEYYGRTHQDQ